MDKRSAESILTTLGRKTLEVQASLGADLELFGQAFSAALRGDFKAVDQTLRRVASYTEVELIKEGLDAVWASHAVDAYIYDEHPATTIAIYLDRMSSHAIRYELLSALGELPQTQTPRNRTSDRSALFGLLAERTTPTPQPSGARAKATSLPVIANTDPQLVALIDAVMTSTEAVSRSTGVLTTTLTLAQHIAAAIADETMRARFGVNLPDPPLTTSDILRVVFALDDVRSQQATRPPSVKDL